MAECGKNVGQGVVAYPCIVELDGSGVHAGPCAARENIRSMNERAKWEAAREIAERAGTPTLEELGMQGPAKTSVDGLLDPSSRVGRRLHPEELRRQKDGIDTSNTEQASLENELVRTAGAVDISGATNLPPMTAQPVSTDEPKPMFTRVESEEVVTGKIEVHDALLGDLIARRNLGIAKYGEALKPYNGRNGVQDAYEEVLDLAAYLKQVLLERDAAAVALYDLYDLLAAEFGDPLPAAIEERMLAIAQAII